MLVLFCPFRSRSDFEPGDRKLCQFYESWWESAAPAQGRRFNMFTMDYYASRELASNKIDTDMLRYTECMDMDAAMGDSFHVSDPNDISEYAFDADAELTTWLPELHAPRIPNILILPHATGAAMLAATSSAMPPSADSISLFTGQQIDTILDRFSAKPELRDPPENSPGAFQAIDIPTKVALLRNAAMENEWVDPSSVSSVPPHLLEAHSSLRTVAASFRLNRKQHKFFIRAGRCLLDSLTQEHISEDEQLIGFLGGLPGSGKSQVIKALQKLASTWNSTDAVGTTACQGVAAQAANGQTLHKFFGWGVHTKTAVQCDAA